MTGAGDEILHATCVAIGAAGLLITGPSGSGKSALALRLMALGARLVADDRVAVRRQAGELVASAPAEIAGMIEARGVGLLAAEAAESAVLRLVIDMGVDETERLPPERTTTVMGRELPLLHNCAQGHFAAAIVQYMRGGRRA